MNNVHASRSFSCCSIKELSKHILFLTLSAFLLSSIYRIDRPCVYSINKKLRAAKKTGVSDNEIIPVTKVDSSIDRFPTPKGTFSHYYSCKGIRFVHKILWSTICLFPSVQSSAAKICSVQLFYVDIFPAYLNNAIKIFQHYTCVEFFKNSEMCAATILKFAIPSL